MSQLISEMFQAEIETQPTLRQSDIIPQTIFPLSVTEGISLRIYLLYLFVVVFRGQNEDKQTREVG